MPHLPGRFVRLYLGNMVSMVCCIASVPRSIHLRMFPDWEVVATSQYRCMHTIHVGGHEVAFQAKLYWDRQNRPGGYPTFNLSCVRYGHSDTLSFADMQGCSR